MAEQLRKRVNVLMVEDNFMDAILTTETLSESEKGEYIISTAKDAFQALDWLRKSNGHNGTARPDLIILDLNLPKMHGLEFLSKVRKDKNFTDVPVVILTTSEDKNDMEKAKELRVSSYLLKPIDLEQFESIVF